MGLAAQQARLLTITSRKSDCEYQSMQLSHQKLSVARDLENISSEYQNSLSQTKLIYDYYGTGTSTDRLNYTMLMTPSTLNDYTPVTISAASGKVVLNGAYAVAAKAAGIPAEGLGTIPSSEVRNKFLQGLCSEKSGLLTESVAKKFQEIPYNQYLGMGETGSETVYFTYQTQLESGILNEYNNKLLDLLENCRIELPNNTTDDFHNKTVATVDSNGTVKKAANASITLKDLIEDKTQYNLFACAPNDSHYPEDEVQKLNEYISGTFLQLLKDAFAQVLKTNDQRSTQALNYALTKMTEIMPTGKVDGVNPNNHSEESDWKNDNYLKSQIAGCVWRVKKGKASDHETNAIKGAENYLGTVVTSHWKGGVIGKKFNSAAAVNLNNIAQAFLSYFVDFMSGIEGGNIYQPTIGALDEKELVTKADPNYIYEINDPDKTKTYDSDSARISQFYDTLLNQICINGWMENNNVLDADYLQKMIQNGSMFITRQKDDGFYYQINYGTDTYIKEVTDDEAVARAEAKYNTMKAKLSSKEQTIDLKMKNLDTEITSLTTEYDTIKNTLTKNIEKSFKRYSA